MPRDMGDFARSPLRVALGAAAYVWKNDGDRNLYTTDGVATSTTLADADRAHGLELSGGLRGHGFTLDASWHRLEVHTIDPAVTAGVFRNGQALYHVTGFEGGYMAIPGTLEFLGGLDTLAIAARPSTAWRPSFGANWYVNQHRLKFQFMHREAFNVLGHTDVRGRTSVVQAQLYF
jgi:hypothetical protein